MADPTQGDPMSETPKPLITLTHELKCWPEQYQAIVDRRKTFEVRKTDRAFQTGDVLWLREYEPDKSLTKFGRGYTGRELKAEVMFLMLPGQFGLGPDVCVMSIRVYVDSGSPLGPHAH